MNPPILHEHLTLIEVAEALILDGLYADPRTAQYLLTRLGPTAAIVAPNQMDVLQARLVKLGHTPKVREG